MGYGKNLGYHFTKYFLVIHDKCFNCLILFTF